MQFIYDENAGAKTLILDAKQKHYLFNVRRFKAQSGEIFKFANLKDGRLYRYKIIRHCERDNGARGNPQDLQITQSNHPPIKKSTKNAESRVKSATFHLLDSANITQNSPKTHIIQAIIDEFDKVLPALNELFVEKITLFYADFSQKNIRVNLERLEAILISSSMQCGRLRKMEIEILGSLDCVVEKYSDAVALDFVPKARNLCDFKRFIIGPEGGFSPRERELLNARKIAISGINHPLILRAKTTSILIASCRI